MTLTWTEGFYSDSASYKSLSIEQGNEKALLTAIYHHGDCRASNAILFLIAGVRVQKRLNDAISPTRRQNQLAFLYMFLRKLNELYNQGQLSSTPDSQQLGDLWNATTTINDWLMNSMNRPDLAEKFLADLPGVDDGDLGAVSGGNFDFMQKVTYRRHSLNEIIKLLEGSAR